MPRDNKRPRTKRARRVESLDGLRTFAILAVVLYHLAVPWLPSGHMGVVIFLVLTGYLASSTVLRTIRKEGGVSLPRLWLHRIARIWPAMATMIVFTVALCAAFNHVLLTKIRPDLVPSLLFANNIAAILRGASYFDNLGGTPPLTHLWYLGIDFQFFVVWTALVSFLCPNGRSNRIARRCALVLALISAILMIVFYDPNADPTRVYYGPDTRAFAPLLGAWLGLAWPLGGRPVRLDRNRHTVRSVPLDIVGPVCLIALVVIMVLAPATSAFLYRGGMLLVSLLTVGLIACLLDRRTILYKVFSLPPLVWLGKRSFGIYLWHFPLFQLFKVTNVDTSPLMIVLALVLSYLMAELSLHLVEEPIAQNRLPFIIGDGPDPSRGGIGYLPLVPVATLAIALAGGAVGLAVVPDESAVPEEAIASTGAGATETMDLTDRLADQENADDEEDAEADQDSEETEEKPAEEEEVETTDLPQGSITLSPSKKMNKDGKFTPIIIADSVAGSTEWYLDEHIPDALLDSYVGRRPDQALVVLKSYIDKGVVGDIVVICSFSNMPATDDAMDELVEACGDRSVYLINVRIPNVELEQINDTVKRCCERNKNCTLIDWYSYSEGHTDWFYDDGIHLTPEGQPHYIDLISNSISADYAKLGGKILSEEEVAAQEEEEAEAEASSDEESQGTEADTTSTDTASA